MRMDEDSCWPCGHPDADHRPLRSVARCTHDTCACVRYLHPALPLAWQVAPQWLSPEGTGDADRT